MKTSIEHIRTKITELEARITDLRIAERELEALGAVSAPRGKLKAKAKRKPATDNASEARQTVGAAITEVLKRTGALPLAELAEQLRAAEMEVSSGTLSNTLQTMKKRGTVKSGGGKWMLPKTRAKRARA
jgi:DNA-binding transcriptional regulator YhcF (GntR family)